MSNSDHMNVELTSRQQSLLLEGLRYLTSSVRLRCEDPTEKTIAARQEQIDELRELASLIEGNAPAEMVGV